MSPPALSLRAVKVHPGHLFFWTCWGCYSCWCWWWETCLQKFVADLEAEAQKGKFLFRVWAQALKLNALGLMCLWEWFLILDLKVLFPLESSFTTPTTHGLSWTCVMCMWKFHLQTLNYSCSFWNLTVLFFVGNHCMLPVMTLRQLRHILPPKIPSCDIASISRRTWKQLLLSLTEPISPYRHQYHSKVFNISEGNANQFQYGLIAIESRF